MSAIHNSLCIWIGVRREKVLVLAPNDSGMPEPVDDHTPMLRARYLSPGGVEQQLESGVGLLNERESSLLIRTESEAPPSVTALLFAPEGAEGEVDFVLGGHPKRVPARLYRAATTAETAYGWHSDLAHGRLGYFVTGTVSQRYLWRIRRVETDHANRLSFTIQPLTLPNGLPSIDAAAVKDALIRQEVEQHWGELAEVYLRGLPYRSVNAARDICECLLTDAMGAAGHLQIGKHELFELLSKLRSVIDSERHSPHKSVPFEDLHYHLMSKLRLLHARTHVGRAVTSGKLSPELALSAVQDVIEVMRAAGLAKLAT